jgi:hypothetical protein
MGKSTGLAQEQDRALGRLSGIPDTRGLYLAGGSAVALHLGHRRSNDLDFFSVSASLNLTEMRDRIIDAAPDVEIVSVTDACVRLRLESAAVDIVRYRYAPLEAPRPGPHGVLVAGLTDLATMKLAAIAGRGLRRDFWDLYEILRSGIPLEQAAAAYLTRFGLHESDLYHVARALTYFEDAEADPAFPAGLSKKKWGQIKAFFKEHAPRLLTAP